jgi:hypothetical protein
VNQQLLVSVVDGKLVIEGIGQTFEIVTSAPVEPPVDPPVEPPVVTVHNVWVDHDELMALPTSGPAWDALLKIANSATFDGADVSNQDSTHSRSILAAALAGVRTGNVTLMDKAVAGLGDAIDTEEGARWLAIGRNMGAYIIAADVLDIREGPVYDWLKRFASRTLGFDNDTSKQVTLKECAWNSASNAPSQEGFVLTALAVYLKDKELLDYCWDCFKRYCGDTSAKHTFSSNGFGDPWQVNNTDAGRVAILPVGAFKNGLDLNGSLTNDMGRSNPKPVNPLVYKTESLYPWVGLDGAFCTAMVLHRAGYPAFEIQDQALLRAVKFLRRVAADYKEPRWWGQDKKEDAKWLAHVFYNLPLADYPITLPVANHDLVGYVDWTHPSL